MRNLRKIILSTCSYRALNCFTSINQNIHTHRRRMTGSAGITVSNNVECPPLDADSFLELEDLSTCTVTKYLDDETAFNSCLGGTLRIGTIQGYRRTEQSIDDRFGDVQEGNVRHSIDSKTGLIGKIKTRHGVIEGGKISADNHVVIERTANDYCWCASIGEFSEIQVSNFRSNNNISIKYYITYDLNKLISAINSYLKQSANKKNLKTLSRPILYTEKDKYTFSNISNIDLSEADEVNFFLSCAFIKSAANFAHENEYRIVVTDPERMGVLSSDSDPICIQSADIASSIIAFGPC